MAGAERIFRHRDLNQRALSRISGFLLENFARPDVLGNIPSIGMSTKKGPFHWVRAAYFLGKEGVSDFNQNSNGEKAWTRFISTDVEGTKTNHYISVGRNLPIVELSADPGLIQMADQVNSFNAPQELLKAPTGGEMPAIHIPLELRNSHRIGSKVQVDSAIFIDIPKPIQESLGISLSGTSFLIATKISRVT